MSQDENSTLDSQREPNEPEPRRIGPYHILERLGDGGMGTVYLAQQKEPVRRRVALKVIKLGMATAEVLNRFDLERQALAVMNHPGIAKVFDAGTTESGQAYFVMEFVEGLMLTEYCDMHRLSVKERIRLFQQICAAVQHAHQKGVIHRDLKPGNVLVQRHDHRVLPKIIDFGLARATNQQLVAHTVYTEQGQMLGTPEYMSPEQATMDAEGIDTRSDIYSLGVMLYELLCGELPFSTAELRAAGLFEVQRKIREDEPPRPSTKITSAGPAASEFAQRRRTSLLALMKKVRGDLDWIVMKAMAKEAERRYESANGLAEDLQRHLEHEPVLAGPPSTTYRLRKFLRRYRTQAVAAALVFVALVTGIIGTSAGFAKARDNAILATERATSLAAALTDAEQQRARAEGEAARAKHAEAEADSEAEKARAAEADAELRATELEQVVGFQEKQLGDVDPAKMGIDLRKNLVAAARAAMERSTLERGSSDARQAAIEELLQGVNFTDLALDMLETNIFARALAGIDVKFADQPLVIARLLQAEADSLVLLGLLASASDPQTRALAIRRRELGDDHADTLTSIASMGFLLYVQGKYDEAEPLLVEALEGRRRVLGDDHPDTLRSFSYMGLLLHAQARHAEAESYYTEALEGRRRVLGDDHEDTLISINNMGLWLQSQGKLAEAEPYYREALEGFRRVLGENHQYTLNAINNMGYLLQAWSKYAEAEPYFREALAGKRRVLGDDHPDTLISINNMGYVLHSLGRLAEAEPYRRESLEGCRRVLGDDHPDTLLSINSMGFLLHSQGKLTAAEASFREALEGRRRVLGREHGASVESLGLLIDLLEQRGDSLAVDALRFGNDAADKAEAHRNRMSAIADGELTAESSDEWVHAAYDLYGQGLLLACWVTFDEAFDDGGPLLLKAHRYNAARAAIRLGCGEGEDAGDLSVEECLDFLRNGREMLVEELADWRELIARGEGLTARQLATWCMRDPDLACVRDAAALKALDGDEAEAWRVFWAEVEALPPPGR